MIVHYSERNLCNSNFLVAKITREIYEDEDLSNRCIAELEEKFSIPIYLFCEESSVKTRGDTEWICGYINLYETTFSFKIIEID